MNIVDSLVVVLGLDPKDFLAGAKAASEASRKAKGQLAADAKAIEASGKQAAEFFSRLKTEALGFFAVIYGGVGLAEFVKNTIDMNAGIARMSKNLNISTEQLSAWQGAVKQTSGSVQDATTSLQSLQNIFEEIKFTGTTSKTGILRNLGILPSDLKDSDTLLRKLAVIFSKMNPGDAQYAGQLLGLTPSMINLLGEGLDAVNAKLRESTHVTAEQAKAAEDAQARIQAMQQRFQDLGNRILTDLLPTLTKFADFLEKLATWGEEHPRIIAEGLALIMLRVAASGVAALIAAGRWLAFGRAVASASAAGAAGSTAAGGAAAAGGVGAGTLALPLVAPIAGYEVGRLIADWGAKGLPKNNWNKDPNPFSSSNLKRLFGGATSFENYQARFIAAQQADAAAGGGKSPNFNAGGLPLGVMAGLYAESGLNPNATNPKSGAFGIGQWLDTKDGKRLSQLRAFAAARGKPINDLTTQLAFVQFEMGGGTGDAGAIAAGKIAAGGDPEATARAMINLYERPAKGYETYRDIQAAMGYIGKHGGSSSSSVVNIQTLNVNAPKAESAADIARDIKEALRNNSMVAQANTGMF